MTTASNNDRIDIDVAIGFYQAWLLQGGKGEITALGQLSPQERKAMEGVVKFYLDHQKRRGASSLLLTADQKDLIQRLGVLFPLQRIKDQFALLAHEVEVKTSQEPSKPFSDELSNYTKEKYPALDHPVVQAIIQQLPPFSPGHLQDLLDRFNQALESGFEGDLTKRVAKTVSLLTPMVRRDEKIDSLVAEAKLKDQGQIDTDYQKAILELNKAILAADHTQYRLPLIRALMNVLGYKTLEAKDLERAKGERALAAYIATKEDKYLLATLAAFQGEGMAYVLNKGLETGDEPLIDAASSALLSFFQEKVKKNLPFSNDERAFLEAVTGVKSDLFNPEIKKAFQIVDEASSPDRWMERLRKVSIENIYNLIFKNREINLLAWEPLTYRLQSLISNLDLFKEHFRSVSEKQPTIWNLLYRGDEKTVVEALLNYFPRGENRASFVQVLTTFDCLIEVYKKAGAKEEDIIRYLAQIFSMSLIKPNAAVRRTIPFEGGEARKRIETIMATLLKKRVVIFVSMGGPTLPLSA